MRYAILLIAVAACDPEGPPAEPILSIDGFAENRTYRFTHDALFVSDGGHIEEFDLDGVSRGMVTTDPHLFMAAGHGWVTWSGVTALPNGGSTATLFRKSGENAIEQSTIPTTIGANIDALVPTPSGIVISDSTSRMLWFWGGGTTVEPLELGETDVWPFQFDSDWLYGSVNGSTRTGSFARFSLDGTRKEELVAGGLAVAFEAHGQRGVYVANDDTASVHLLDLVTLEDREIGELGYPVYYNSLAIDDGVVFVGRYRSEGADDLAPFLPLAGNRVTQVDVVGEYVFWGTEYLDQNGYPRNVEISRTTLVSPSIASPTATDDSRPPWL